MADFFVPACFVPVTLISGTTLTTHFVTDCPTPRRRSKEKYNWKQILPLFRKHKVVHFNKIDTSLENDGLPMELQNLQCQVNYNTLKFTPRIEDLGLRLVKMLQEKGFFIVLHLIYEMDMLAFSGYTHGHTEEEANELTQMRYAYMWWKEKEIKFEQKILEGLCSLTPKETALVLKALGFDKKNKIHISNDQIKEVERVTRYSNFYDAD